MPRLRWAARSSPLLFQPKGLPIWLLVFDRRDLQKLVKAAQQQGITQRTGFDREILKRGCHARWDVRASSLIALNKPRA
jgi:hypothetical protein